MTTIMKLGVAVCSALALAAALPAAAAEPTKAPTAHVDNYIPEGGVTVVATFSQMPYTYAEYRQAVALEVPLMAKNGVKLVHSYRVLIGGMDKYFDIWWAPDYKTMYDAFYNPKVTDPEFDKIVAKTKGLLLRPTIEIVEEQKF